MKGRTFFLFFYNSLSLLCTLRDSSNDRDVWFDSVNLMYLGANRKQADSTIVIKIHIHEYVLSLPKQMLPNWNVNKRLPHAFSPPLISKLMFSWIIIVRKSFERYIRVCTIWRESIEKRENRIIHHWLSDDCIYHCCIE